MPVPPSRRAALQRRLLAWYDADRRELPWRFPQGEADPYRVWIAEVMLQQTQVAAVVPYYQRFIARFPSLSALAAAREPEVLALWSGLGYYARARRLPAAAREALARHGGLPADAAALGALPGFGRYTTGAVASIAFGLRSPAVDGNVARVLARLFLVEDPPDTPRGSRRLWSLAGALVPAERPGDFNQALMDLGATVCRKPAPACPDCPLAAHCEARRSGRESLVPAPRRRPDPKLLVFACAVVRRGERILLARRPPGGLFGGLWELPSAEVAGAADPRAALREALVDRHALAVSVGEEIATVERALTHRRLLLRAFRCGGAGEASATADLRFAAPGELDALALPTAMRRLADAVVAAATPSPDGRRARAARRDGRAPPLIARSRR